MRYVGKMVVLGMAMGLLASAEPPPRSGPPEGWENEVIPGFDPSIESILVKYPHSEQNVMRPFAEGWGPKAAPALIRLYEDARWVQFHSAILNLLECTGTSEARQWFIERFQALASTPELTDAQEAQVYGLAYHLSRLGGDDIFQLLAEQTKNGKGIIQSAADNALFNMGGQRVLDFFRELASKTTAQGQAQRYRYEITELEGRIRAQEPMSRILEVEASTAGK